MENITGRFIVEILGAPKEYIEKALKEHINKVKQEYQVLEEKYSEPEQKDDLWSQFVELKIRFETPQDLLNFCFDSMPSSVELLEPEKLAIEIRDLEDLLNDFQAKLHHTDMMLKNINAQKQVLDRNAINILHNFIKYACSQKPHTIEELEKLLGLTQKDLNKFIEHLVKKGVITKEGNAYRTVETAQAS